MDLLNGYCSDESNSSPSVAIKGNSFLNAVPRHHSIESKGKRLLRLSAALHPEVLKRLTYGVDNSDDSEPEGYEEKIKKSSDVHANSQSGIQSLIDELRIKPPRCGNIERTSIPSTILENTQEKKFGDVVLLPENSSLKYSNYDQIYLMKRKSSPIKQRYITCSIPVLNENSGNSLKTTTQILTMNSAPPLKLIDGNSIDSLYCTKEPIKKLITTLTSNDEVKPPHKKTRKEITAAIRRGDLSTINEIQTKIIDRNRFSHDEPFIPASSYTTPHMKPVSISNASKISSKQKSKHQIHALVRNAASLEAERSRKSRFGLNTENSSRIDAKKKYGW